ESSHFAGFWGFGQRDLHGHRVERRHHDRRILRNGRHEWQRQCKWQWQLHWSRQRRRPGRDKMNPTPIQQRARRAFTQAEMLVSLAVLALLSAAMAVGAITIQRSFQASQNYAQKEADQMRLLDYLALDLRGALTVHTDNATGTIQLTMPDYYQADGTPRDPHIVNGMAYYGDPTQPIHVTYSKQNGTLVRQEGTRITNVAKDVQDFNVAFQDEGQVVEVSVSFVP